jgi:hypothetical protein
VCYLLIDRGQDVADRYANPSDRIQKTSIQTKLIPMRCKRAYDALSTEVAKNGYEDPPTNVPAAP